MSDIYRGKHAGGKYVYGELVFKSDSPFINDGDGLVGVFAATVQVKAANKWADITDSLYFSLRDRFEDYDGETCMPSRIHDANQQPKEGDSDG